ncbi:MAG: hypothetical protein LWW86_09390 [Micrococcales bacterium]|nr:hypothetical protein [Micrococcales bacterium]
MIVRSEPRFVRRRRAAAVLAVLSLVLVVTGAVQIVRATVGALSGGLTPAAAPRTSTTATATRAPARPTAAGTAAGPTAAGTAAGPTAAGAAAGPTAAGTPTPTPRETLSTPSRVPMPTSTTSAQSAHTASDSAPARPTAPPADGSTQHQLPSATAQAPSTTTPSAPASPALPARPALAADQTRLQRVERIAGVTPKGIAAGGGHVITADPGGTMTLFRSDGRRAGSVSAAVTLLDHGIGNHPGRSTGSPLEAAVSPDGRTAWVVSQAMTGAGFGAPGKDSCSSSDDVDDSFVYRVDLTSRAVTRVVPVGASPRKVALTPDGKRVLVANWCSADLSVVDVATNKEVSRIPLGGSHPRGLVSSPDSRHAYVALMGSDRVVEVDLATRAVQAHSTPGDGPRDLLLARGDLYAVANGDGAVVRVVRGHIATVARVGPDPRALARSSDGTALYAIDHADGTLTKLRAKDLAVLGKVHVDARPTALAYDPLTERVWVACESGSVVVFDDSGAQLG